jgi:formate hydrogenlyase transcriptional activator
VCPLERSSNIELDYHRYARLLELAEAVSFRDEPIELFQALAPRLRSILSFDFINLAIYSPFQKNIRMFIWDGGDIPSDPVEISPDASAVGWVWKNQIDFSVGELLHEKRFRDSLQCLRDRHLRSYCVLPLTTARERIGAIGFGSKLPQAFTAHDQLFLHRVAEMVALCMDESVAEVALSLAPLVSPARVVSSHTDEKSPDNAHFSQRDLELLQQIAACLVPLVERNPTTRDRAFEDLNHRLGYNLASACHTRTDETSGARPDHPGSLPLENLPPLPAIPVSDSLREWEQLLAVYANASHVGLCILDCDFRYRVINSTLAEMNGQPVHLHLGRTVHEVLGEGAADVEAYIASVVSSGQSILDLHVSFQLPNKSEPSHWIANYLPIKDASGRVRQIGAVIVEITLQKKLEDSLRHLSETLKSEKKRGEVMTEVGRLLAAKLDLRQAFPQISAYLRRLLHQEYAALSLHCEKTGALVLRAIDFPLQKNTNAQLDTFAHEDPESQALRMHVALILSREEMQQSKSTITKHLIAEGLQSLCCVPILRPRGCLGVLVLGSTRPTAFNSEDLVLLNQVAAQLAIALENDLASRQLDQIRSQIDLEKSYLKEDSQPLLFPGLVGDSPALRQVLKRVAIVAETNATVLLLGETGTGKGLVARALHQSSRRKDKNFITLNCAAIPTGLLESELFGHERGAFTGAVSQKVGRLELADGGTLFLDEIGEISPDLQPKLLRVLQDHEFERLGSVKTIKVDLRLIAATNRDLAKSVADKEFRSDLFYRLNVFPIRMPLLRERRADIPILVRHFVREFAARMDRTIETISQETMETLTTWHWPGNIRELENFIERSVILTEGTCLHSPLEELYSENPDSTDLSLEDSERELIIRVLRETRGLMSGPAGAAQRLGLKRTTLQSKLQRLEISPRDYSAWPLD